MLFFFSSRRRHTTWPRDWSSDVCSSDLVEAVLAAGHPHRLHHRVGGEEPAPEVRQQAFERAALVGQRLAQDEVLHGVRRHNGGVVALSVGGGEVLAEHLDAHRAGEHVVVAVGALDDALERDAQLAVGDPHAGIASRRWWAIRAISASAVRSSVSGSLRTRACAAARIESLSWSRTQITNGKPNFSR